MPGCTGGLSYLEGLLRELRYDVYKAPNNIYNKKHISPK